MGVGPPQVEAIDQGVRPSAASAVGAAHGHGADEHVGNPTVLGKVAFVAHQRHYPAVGAIDTSQAIAGEATIGAVAFVGK